jgi:trans-aconitate 2-methyltransferase
MNSQLAQMTDWDPSLYLQFENERMRAARHLLAEIPLASAGLVYDLGCGPGNSAELLSRRFPEAQIIGLDTSDSMLDHARKRTPQARFIKQDIADWTPDDRPQLIFANAALQFLPDHETLFPRLASYLARGGVFAAQMPDMAHESSHAVMRLVAVEGPWWSRLLPIAKAQPLVAAFENYYEWLRPAASRIEMWRTIYLHAFDGPQIVADFFASSALQPFLERLDDEERSAFMTRYRDRIKDAYPARSDGQFLIAYPRLFIIATR